MAHRFNNKVKKDQPSPGAYTFCLIILIILLMPYQAFAAKIAGTVHVIV